MGLERTACKTWLPSGSMLRHLLWPHLTHPRVVILEMQMRCFSSWVCPGCLLEQPTVCFKWEVRQNDGKTLSRHYWLWIYANLICLLFMCLLAFWQVCFYCCISLIWRYPLPSPFMHTWNRICFIVNDYLISWQIIIDSRFHIQIKDNMVYIQCFILVKKQ